MILFWNSLKTVYFLAKNLIPDELQQVADFDATSKNVKMVQSFIIDVSSLKASLIGLTSLWLHIRSINHCIRRNFELRSFVFLNLPQIHTSFDLTQCYFLAILNGGYSYFFTMIWWYTWLEYHNSLNCGKDSKKVLSSWNQIKSKIHNIIIILVYT